jgi:hypothetical protein
MARVVASVAADYEGVMKWEKVITKEMDGAMRLGELAKQIGRLPPVPSIFIDSELVFEVTPGTEELRAVLDRRLGRSV